MSTEHIFSALSSEQYNELKEALAYITVLVAGADGNIDEQELNWAEKLTSIRSYAKPAELNAYYGDVERHFKHDMERLRKELPKDQKAREEIIVRKLGRLNTILTHLDNDIAYQLYESFTSFARHIAKASGGFLRFGSISSKEKQWINLSMITPIIREIPEEEE